jgi:hypothetical protein
MNEAIIQEIVDATNDLLNNGYGVPNRISEKNLRLHGYVRDETYVVDYVFLHCEMTVGAEYVRCKVAATVFGTVATIAIVTTTVSDDDCQTSTLMLNPRSTSNHARYEACWATSIAFADAIYSSLKG